MNPTLRNKLVAAIAGGSGAITIAAVMLGNADGLEGRRYYAYQMSLASGLYAMGTLELTYAAVTAIPTGNAMLYCSQTCARWQQPSIH